MLWALIPPSMDIYSKDRERREIDAEISRLAEHIRSLRSRRNSLAPISKLPNEILISIFENLVQQTRDSTCIIPLASVCGLWRRLAINSSVLWSYLGCVNADVTPLMLERSKEALLVLEIFLDFIQNTFEKDFLLQNFQRIREIVMTFDPGDPVVDSLIQQLLCYPRPLIEVLVLRSDADEPLHMTGLLGASAAGNLRELTLSGVSTDCLPSFTHLTRLNVSCDPDLDPLAALVNMPNLRSLRLELDTLQCCPPTYEGDTIPQPKAIVHLPALEELNIAAALSHAAFLINHLHFPPSTLLELFTLTTSTDGWARPPTLLQFIAHHKRDPAERLRVSCQGHKIHFKCDLFDWVAKMKCAPENVGPALHCLAQAIQFEHLELKLRCWEAASLDWAMVLCKLTRIRTLDVGVLIEAQELLKSITTQDTSTLPNLQRLIVVITPGEDNSYNDYRFDRVVDFLQVRREAGVGVSEVKLVIIEECEGADEVTQEELDRLEALARVVVERSEI